MDEKITKERLIELWQRLSEIIKGIRDSEQIKYIESLDMTKETAAKNGILLEFLIKCKKENTPKDEIIKGINQIEKEQNIKHEELNKKTDEEKIILISKLSEIYDQKTLYEMSEILGLKAWYWENEDKKNFCYIESELWYILIDKWEMQSYETLEEVIAIQTIKNWIKETEQRTGWNKSKSSKKQLATELRQENDEEKEKDTITVKREVQKYTTNWFVKKPDKFEIWVLWWITGQTWIKVIEKEGETTTSEENNWWKIFWWWYLSYTNKINEKASYTFKTEFEWYFNGKKFWYEYNLWIELQKDQLHWELGMTQDKYWDKTRYASGWIEKDIFYMDIEWWYTKSNSNWYSWRYTSVETWVEFKNIIISISGNSDWLFWGEIKFKLFK